MSTVKAEITFMVYGQNGVGKIQKRILELEHQDFIACTSSNRDKNEQLNVWAKNMFPTAQKVKIQTASKIVETAKNVSKKTERKKKSVFRGNPIFLPFRIIWYLIRRIWRLAEN